MRLARIALIVTALLVASAAFAHAVTTALKWVEVDLSLKANGKATLTYKIRYNVLEGKMRGFYFQGFNGAMPKFADDKCHAITSGGRKHGLSITEVESGKYDIVLANGAAETGEITYILLYDTDLFDSGMLGYTDSKFGKLAYLDWAPNEWGKPMEHETIYLHYPIKVKGKTVDKALLKKVGFKTEKFVNANYLISYYGQPYNGKNYLTVRFHKKNPPARYHMAIKCYIDGKYFTMKAPPKPKPTPQPTQEPPSQGDSGGGNSGGSTDYYPGQPWGGTSYPRSPDMGFGGVVVIGIIIFILVALIRWKMANLSQSADQLDDISWERGDWTPPKIKVSTFRQEGKVADLEPVEAALLLDVPSAKIAGTIIAHMEHKGLVKVISLDPIKVERLDPIGVVPDNMYESILWNAIRKGGKLDDVEMKALFKEIADKTQAKAWDCDLEATKAYYRKQIQDQYERIQRGEDTIDTSYTSLGHSYSNYYAFYFYSHLAGIDGGRPSELSHAISDQGIIAADTIAQSQSVQVDACHDACYVHTACHDACHDACHSACHDACHSACHDACHSACVSGGEH